MLKIESYKTRIKNLLSFLKFKLKITNFQFHYNFFLCLTLLLTFSMQSTYSQNSTLKIKSAWSELVKDNDVVAFRIFNEEYQLAKTAK